MSKIVKPIGKIVSEVKQDFEIGEVVDIDVQFDYRAFLEGRVVVGDLIYSSPNYEDEFEKLAKHFEEQIGWSDASDEKDDIINNVLQSVANQIREWGKV